jgi:hypothetical protein
MCLVFTLLALLSCWFSTSSARSDDYYQILREFSEGKDFYAILGVSEEATTSEMKKAYHKQSLI